MGADPPWLWTGRGYEPVGVGAGNGLSPITVGELSGNESVTLTINQLPAHTHTATATAGTASASISIPATTTNTGEGATPGNTTVLGPIAAGGRPGTLYSTSAANTSSRRPSVPSAKPSAASSLVL